MPLWLTYGLLFGCAALLGAGFWLSGDRGAARFPKVTRFATVFQMAAIALAYGVLRPGDGDNGNVDIATARAEGKPIFVDLYSNF